MKLIPGKGLAIVHRPAPAVFYNPEAPEGQRVEIPERAREAKPWAKVVAVAEDVTNMKVDDIVYLDPFAGTEIKGPKIFGLDLFFIKAEENLAHVVDGEPLSSIKTLEQQIEADIEQGG